MLGLVAALAYGISDFVAGLGSRRLHFLWVTALAQVVGAAVALLTLIWFRGAGPTATAVGWGAASGVGSSLGTFALYRGYGHGEMAVAGPLSAIGAAAVPALVGVLLGDRLAGLSVAGIVLALPAIWLMARTPAASAASAATGRRVRVGVLDGLLSGMGFGLLFIALSLAGSGAGLWPVAAGQVVALVLDLAVLGVVRPPWPGRTARRPAGSAAAAGLLGIAATVLFFLATHASLLAIAAVLTSLYPAFTVGLAAWLLGERPGTGQWVGLALGAVAVVLIVVG